MLRTLGMMYVTLVPTIVAGIANMIWCKSGILKVAKVPMDGGRCLKDGRRIFGDNKTWKGFLGYVILNVIAALVWGIISNAASLNSLNFFYANHDNTFSFNLLIGFLLGLGYAAFELPNSFLNRRLDVRPGMTLPGAWTVFFIFLDQADSLFGCVLTIWIFYDLGIGLYLLYVLVGALTHMVLNMLLYFVHLRKNMF